MGRSAIYVTGQLFGGAHRLTCRKNFICNATASVQFSRDTQSLKEAERKEPINLDGIREKESQKGCHWSWLLKD